jgi:hypothetical protein
LHLQPAESIFKDLFSSCIAGRERITKHFHSLVNFRRCPHETSHRLIGREIFGFDENTDFVGLIFIVELAAVAIYFRAKTFTKLEFRWNVQEAYRVVFMAGQRAAETNNLLFVALKTFVIWRSCTCQGN